jgi:hypothetical protein
MRRVVCFFFFLLLTSTAVFHHDGPFDACNPHRNRKGMRAAPMQAFPKDSKNMAIGGSGPNNSEFDLALFHGQTTEGYLDYSMTAERKKNQATFDATRTTETIHGQESLGLGTSTFLEGTPASKAAIQRRQSETEHQIAQNGGIQRRKSLAQKIRGINRTNTGRTVSPEPPTSPGSRGGSASAAIPSSTKSQENNPFFQDYDEAYDKKTAHIQIAEEKQLEDRARTSISPQRAPALERKATSERTGGFGMGEESKSANGGFINRMKSLRKTRPERRSGPD